MFLHPPLMELPNLLAMVKAASVAILGFRSLLKAKRVSSAAAYGFDRVVNFQSQASSSSRISGRP